MEENSGFYRIELDGARVSVSFEEIHELRKDILLYFDENIGESSTVLLPVGLDKSYWKFISIDFEQEWAESVRYRRVVEEGCLALLNGIALDLLEEPANVANCKWLETPTVLAYLNHYQPSSNKLQTAKSYLIQTYNFILSATPDDFDGYGSFLNFTPWVAGRWFDKEIVQAYYQWKLAAYT